MLRVQFFLLVALTPTLAQAYIGPGAGISAFGSLLALIAAMLLAIVGFVWYPLKRLARNRRQTRADAADKDEAAPS